MDRSGQESEVTIPKYSHAINIIAVIVIGLILTGAISSCKDDPVTPPGGKDSCDTCVVCDTCDTTDTVVVTPNDTTSHNFVWSEYSIPGEASISGCWVFNDSTIWVMSNRLYTLKNATWQSIPLKNQQDNDLGDGLSGSSLFAHSMSDVWILYLGILWHYNGTVAHEFRIYEDGLGILNSSSDGAIRAAWGTSSNDMFFVGDKGTIVHFDGTNWMKFPKVTEKNLVAVWGTSTTDVWASGWSSSTAASVLLHYDGSAWTEINVSEIGWIGPGKHALITVWATDNAGHKVVLAGGSLLWRKTDNGPWRQDSADLRNRLNDGGFSGIGIRGNIANDLLAAGPYGYLSHWNGKSWHRFDDLWQPGNAFYAASTMSMNGNTAVVAGSKNGSWIAVGRRAK
jgi:hypothetical protein